MATRAGSEADRPAFDAADVAAVSFDLDDTFWECAPAIEHAEAVTWQWMQENTPRVTARLTRATLLDHRRQVVEEHPELACDVTLSRKRSMAVLFAEFGYPSTLAEQAFAVFYRARSEVILFEGVDELLTALTGRYRLAAITNGNADLALIGIEHRFEAIYHASIDHPPKPAAFMFERCAAGFDVPLRQLLHVGDNPYTDVGGAHAAGAAAVWFNATGAVWPVDVRPAVLEVASLDELQRRLV